MKSANFKNSCRVALNYLITRYLICNSEGSQDGAEKADTHRELCNFYIAVKYGLKDSYSANKYLDDFDLIHDATQELTSYMDTQIGFPIKGRPDYDILVPKFFERFHDLAIKSLSIYE